MADTNVLDALRNSTAFLDQAISRQILAAYPNVTTETYSYLAGVSDPSGSSSGTTLYVLQIVYSDSTKATFSSVTRTA